MHTQDQKTQALNAAVNSFSAKPESTATEAMGELAQHTFEAGYALGRTPEREFTADELYKIQQVLFDLRWNWGSFAQTMGQLLRAGDSSTRQKLAKGFPHEFSAWLEMARR
jgi:hypothetical protein